MLEEFRRCERVVAANSEILGIKLVANRLVGYEELCRRHVVSEGLVILNIIEV